MRSIFHHLSFFLSFSMSSVSSLYVVVIKISLITFAYIHLQTHTYTHIQQIYIFCTDDFIHLCARYLIQLTARLMCIIKTSTQRFKRQSNKISKGDRIAVCFSFRIAFLVLLLLLLSPLVGTCTLFIIIFFLLFFSLSFFLWLLNGLTNCFTIKNLCKDFILLSLLCCYFSFLVLYFSFCLSFIFFFFSFSKFQPVY